MCQTGSVLFSICTRSSTVPVRASSPARLADARPGHAARSLSEVLGHATTAITKDVYGHLLEGDRWAAAEAMTRALSARSAAAVGSQVGSQGVAGSDVDG